MTRPTLLGQLSRAHVLVVAGACALLVFATMIASGLLLRQSQDRTLEAMTTEEVNGVIVEAVEDKLSMIDAAEAFFHESHVEGYRFELLGPDGRILAAVGQIPGWRGEDHDAPVRDHAGSPRRRADGEREARFRACTRWCGTDHVLRVVTLDVLHQSAVRRVGGVLLVALPLATLVGAMLGRLLFRRRLRPLGRLEAAAAQAAADPEVTLGIDAGAREIATLQDAFNGLLSRLGDALARERRFAQEASHELRTPLAAIRGRLERLESEGALTPRQLEHARAAIGEVDALDRLVDALMLLARSESAPLPSTPVNLCDLARDVAAKQALRDGALARPPDVEAPDEILVRGSEDLLGRAIANLVENARKFGGPQARIRVRVTEDRSSATVAVADDGPGIAGPERPHVFDRFFRASTTRNGTEGAGLGLAVVRAIAVRHRGEVGVKSSDLGGEEFRIAIPLFSRRD